MAASSGRADVNSRRYRSSAVVKAGVRRVFPAKTGELAYELSSGITFLHLKWKLFRALYGNLAGAHRSPEPDRWVPTLLGI